MKQTLLVLVLACSTLANAQPYNFSQSTSAYAALSGETLLTTTTPWTYASAFTVPIGFTFNFMGTNFTTVYVEGSGFTYFDFNYYNLALPFTVKLQSKGSSGNNSPISYKTVGVAPNRITKVQWKNAGFYYDTTSTINLQMWLYETTNVIEVHIGANNVPNPSIVYQENGSDGPVVGLFEFNSPTNCTYSSILSGSPAAAGVTNPTGNVNIFGTSLTGTPPNGTVYIFDPGANAVNEFRAASFSLYPNPATDFVMIRCEQPIESCAIYALDGALISTQIPTTNRLYVGDLPMGIYLIEVETAGIISRQKLVIR